MGVSHGVHPSLVCGMGNCDSVTVVFTCIHDEINNLLYWRKKRLLRFCELRGIFDRCLIECSLNI